jgi:hypothetical protein
MKPGCQFSNFDQSWWRSYHSGGTLASLNWHQHRWLSWRFPYSEWWFQGGNYSGLAHRPLHPKHLLFHFLDTSSSKDPYCCRGYQHVAPALRSLYGKCQSYSSVTQSIWWWFSILCKRSHSHLVSFSRHPSASYKIFLFQRAAHPRQLQFFQLERSSSHQFPFWCGRLLPWIVAINRSRWPVNPIEKK